MSLARNFSWMAAGRMVYVVAQWLLIVVIARLTSPQTLGEFTYALAVTGPIIIFAQLNMRAFMATDAKDEFPFEDYLRTRLISLGLALAAVVGIASVSGLSIDASLFLILVALYKAVEGVSDVYFGVLQKQEAISAIALSSVARGITAVIAMTGLLIATNSALIGAAGIFIAWMAILLFHDMPAATNRLAASESVTRATVLRVIKTCFPMGLILTLMSLRINVPVYFVKSELGADQVGYYSAIAYFLVAGSLITGSLTQTASPRLARYYHLGKPLEFRRLLLKLLGVVAVAGLVGIIIAYALGDIILGAFYGPAYAGFSDLLVWIMVAGAVNYLSQFLGMSLTVARMLKYQLFSNGIGVAITLAYSYLYIPSQGLTGGALALVAGAAATLVFNSLVVATKLDLRDSNSLSVQRIDD